MPIRPIVIHGEPCLHQRAEEVSVFDEELRTLVADMFETMDAAPGVGLAAPQVGVSKRLFVYSYPDDDDNPRRGVIINPVIVRSPIIHRDPDEDEESEGCLSVPGERFPIQRADKVTIQGVDLDQKPVKIEAEGWFARVFQHEYDHLDGILYVDKLNFDLRKQAEQAIKKLGWGKPGLSWLPGKDKLEG